MWLRKTSANSEKVYKQLFSLSENFGLKTWGQDATKITWIITSSKIKWVWFCRVLKYISRLVVKLKTIEYK